MFHFEIPCKELNKLPSVWLFHHYYCLHADDDWSTFEKCWKDFVDPRCNYMPTSTYPKEWKDRFLFMSLKLIPGKLPFRDPLGMIDDLLLMLTFVIVTFSCLCHLLAGGDFGFRRY
ncbi:hypothetical protein Hanom_Chr09g00847161 [Helianthus anomalus]